MKIEANKEDIQYGVCESRTNCPIANAIRRATGKDVLVWVDEVLIDGTDRVCLPQIASDWIRAYDDGITGAPFEFELNYPTVKPSPSYPGSCESGAVGEISAEDIKPIEP